MVEKKTAGGLTKEEAKEAMKEAVNEWLNKQWIAFGKWTAAGLISLGIAALAHVTHFPIRGFFER